MLVMVILYVLLAVVAVLAVVYAWIWHVRRHIQKCNESVCNESVCNESVCDDSSVMCGVCDHPEGAFGAFYPEEDDPNVVPPPFSEPNELFSEEVFGANGKTYFYAFHSNSPSATFKGWSVQRTNQAIAQAYQEMSSISGAKFKPWSGSGPYHIIIQFKERVGSWNSAGEYRGGKTIYVSSGREFSLDMNSSRFQRYRIAHNIIQHETFHLLNYDAVPSSDKYGHSPDNTCVMNINSTNDFFCPAEVLYMQKRFGKPTEPFMPMDFQMRADVIKALRDELKLLWAAFMSLVTERDVVVADRKANALKRDEALAKRNALPFGPERDVLQREVLMYQNIIFALSTKFNDLTTKIQETKAKAVAQREKIVPEDIALAALYARWKDIPMSKV